MLFQGAVPGGRQPAIWPGNSWPAEDLRREIGVEHVLRLPMQADSRSLNLSNTVSIVVYEAWRQLDFAGSLQVQDNP